MKPAMVVDVGNTRIKWGRCAENAVVESASLPPDDPVSWSGQLERWNLAGQLTWAISGVNPQRRDRLVEWVRPRGGKILLLNHMKQLPLEIAVEQPDRVGMDRLLNAVAAGSRVQGDVPVIIVDAGTAVTVDWLDKTRSFRGGAIFPGLRLMARALHDSTALLPLVDIQGNKPSLPGTSTVTAIEAGIFWAVAGGINSLVRELLTRTGAARKTEVFLTGGDAAVLAPVVETEVHLWPNMTLEGIRLSAERMS